MTDPSIAAVSSYRPDLPDWGAFLRPPASGVDWIHPDDMDQALPMIPSRRVFRRYRWDGEFYWFNYGDTQFRLRPCMWCRLPDVDLEVGQRVELLSHHQRHDAGIYHIAEIVVSRPQTALTFYLRRGALQIEKAFERSDLRPTEVRHALRIGTYPHPRPSCSLPPDYPWLDVGDLLSE